MLQDHFALFAMEINYRDSNIVCYSILQSYWSGPTKYSTLEHDLEVDNYKKSLHSNHYWLLP